MNDMYLIHAKLEQLPHDWSIERTPQIFEPAPSLKDRLVLSAGKLLIAIGQKMISAATLPPRLEKKAI